jgi:hypothetical protein
MESALQRGELSRRLDMVDINMTIKIVGLAAGYGIACQIPVSRTQLRGPGIGSSPDQEIQMTALHSA